MTKILLLLIFLTGFAFAEPPKIEIREGDRIVFVGNVFAERMVRYGFFEAAMYNRFPKAKLSFRNLAWSGDEIWAGNASPEGNSWSTDPLTTQIRPLNFGTQKEHLTEQKADVIIASYGMNESFAGLHPLPKFEHDLSAWVDAQLKENYSGKGAPRIVLISPVSYDVQANRFFNDQPHPNIKNDNLAAYTKVMRKVAESRKTGFVDLFQISMKLYESRKAATGLLTTYSGNGIHLNEAEYEKIAPVMVEAFKKEPSKTPIENDSQLLGIVNEKNLWFFYRYHALNGEYIYGRRKEPFGVVTFPPEMNRLDQIIQQDDEKIWELLKSESTPTP